ncbi:hypothetical protein KO561_03915 [Radiobacillus kanasensis]|uniref:hypothetical protein n=1 Tax=Radiobacillus kanasensis TaxID=2844358 RepID=UPI001E3E4F52|nr:hypothetical protein [Radiobacillus kanasensis]UFU00120.1 hypothetical protein KO561_03915 [Radiobacillus kanasensis]
MKLCGSVNCTKILGGLSIIKKVIGASAVTLGMIILLYLMVGNYYDLQIAGQRASEDVPKLQIMMSLWAFLFGILMEWKGLVELIERKFNFNWKLFIPTVVLFVIVFIPNSYWVKWYGISQDLYPNIFLLPETNLILSVLTGTLLIRSFVKK